MPTPKNGRGKAPRNPPAQQGIAYDSDVLLTDDQLALFRERARAASLEAELLATRNELIKARQMLAEVVDAETKKHKHNDKKAGSARKAGRRGEAIKSKAGRAAEGS